jgi:D-serine deaminase-like pyridoxal phosphate-dependent protein
MDARSLETPALFVDLDVLERNIREMQRRCREWGVSLRPHTKTHKIPEIARLQLEAGAVGITVAKLGEAEVLPGDDVLVAYPLMPDKLPRLRALARSRRVTVTADSVEAARALAGFPTLVEVDVGVGRCGVQTPEQALDVARAATDFQGLLYWPSWLDDAGFREAGRRVTGTLARLKEAGLEARTVSGGSTPGASRTPLIPETTEIRPGTYVFQDASSVSAGVASIEDCALRVLVSVVSDRVPGQCVVDGGSKTFSSDVTRGAGAFGLFPDRPGWVLRQLNEEHGYVALDGKTRLGEKVWVVPSHVCATVNMHDEVFYGRAGEVLGSWKVAARGKVR